MKKAIGIFIFLLLSCFSFATHQVAGYIGIKWLGGFTYQITIYDYTNTYPVGVADRDTLRLWIRDGNNISRLLTRLNGRSNYLLPGDPTPNGEPLCNYDFKTDTPTPLNGARKLNIYQTTYTFTGVGSYRVWVDDPDRMANINNITGSVGVDYYMYSVLTIPSPFNYVNGVPQYISAPMITNPPVCQYGCVNGCYSYNPGAYIPDLPPGAADSIGYSLGKCLMLNPLNPTQPEVAVGYSNPGATINDSGTFKWCPSSPKDTGIWNFAIIMVTYQKIYEALGGGGSYMQPTDTVELELEVNINSICHNPTITSKDTCVVAGDVLTLKYTATVDNLNPLYITASGEPFLESPPATLSGYTPPQRTLYPVLSWTTNCNEVREMPYEIVMAATERIIQPFTDDSAFYTGYSTSYITVVGPAPKHLMAENEGTTVCLHWGPSSCEQDTVYNIYRQKGCSGWKHGYCETGVPSYTGYKLIATIHGKYDTTYCDSNNGAGLSPGVTYSYIVDGLFPLPDGSHSYASNDTCVNIKLDDPLITNVSVTKTDPTNGEIFIRWMKPLADAIDLDTTKYPGPYKYVLEHATGINNSNFSPIATYTTSVFATRLDTTFMDVGLDTKDNSYNYRINFYDSGSNYLGSSGNASSIYLRVHREDKSMNLGWSATVPWTNDTFYVYRENPPPASPIYNFIGKTTKTTYVDTGLHNGSTYCYYVKSVSQYPTTKVEFPLYDSSETICGTPEDTIPPCPPPLNVVAKCVLYEDSLVWSNPDRFCPKANKTVKYEIFYTPVENGDMYVIATINNPEDTIYVNGGLTSVAGCYAVVAIDSAGQSSSLNTECVDNCVIYQLPNVFSPNGDGINDLFTPVEGYRYVKDIDINIYNRWGQIVFHTTNPSINWNGNVDNSGGACPDGVYYYVCVVDEIRVEGIEPVTFKGFIQLIRN